MRRVNLQLRRHHTELVLRRCVLTGYLMHRLHCLIVKVFKHCTKCIATEIIQLLTATPSDRCIRDLKARVTTLQTCHVYSCTLIRVAIPCPGIPDQETCAVCTTIAAHVKDEPGGRHRTASFSPFSEAQQTFQQVHEIDVSSFFSHDSFLSKVDQCSAKCSACGRPVCMRHFRLTNERASDYGLGD